MPEEAQTAEQKDRTQALAFQNAMRIMAGIESDERKIKDRKAALKAALGRQDMDWDAFKEARKRAKQNSHTLDLFDTACMRMETWARKLIAGEVLVEDAERDAIEEAERQAEAKKAAAEKELQMIRAKEVAEAEAEVDQEVAAAGEGPDVTHILPGDGVVGDNALETAQAKDETDPGEDAVEEVDEDGGPTAGPEDNPADEEQEDFGDNPDGTAREEEEAPLQVPEADRDFAKKTARVAPEAGAGGVSMDDIPMPGNSQIHDIAQAQRRRQFKDHRERMSPEQYRNEVGKAQG